ncbi:hypothetical protein BJF93_15205 [Xaviernesmea oryzae]|uniref:Glycosyltransferase 2-like domain-containing protein n=1 Tax=Xaviernesmea oryzae TaxID=464029 RepID=A0A1Q9AXX4_9HYPH|nr:glycosyltransferase family 2 protein [Xaviernesmea oryzae]OLP60304.1 hypothetical protein BJF93_15205 [Xaviernesmea oryzae]SEK24119.1 Glycosyltransferase involved in cell wall bisynthesis [Xaviernesmea oryzae]
MKTLAWHGLRQHVEEKNMAAAVTVVILARNEEQVIERAISSVHWADEVIVVDSESTDKTVTLAQQAGATVIVQPWLGFVAQKQVGVKAARNNWIFSLDADEIVMDDLAMSICAAMSAQPDPQDGYVIRRDEEFLGRIMPSMRRRSKAESFVRLYNRLFSDWNPTLIVHEEIVCPGRTIPLAGRMLHWRNYTIGKQLDTLNRNADLEGGLIASQASTRKILFGMAVKPLLRFAWIYLACGSYRVGIRGFIWAGLHAFAEFLRHAKAWEARMIVPQIHPPADIYPAAVRRAA